MRRCIRWIPLLLVSICAITAGAQTSARLQTIPLCPGLTIVTAVNQQDGDYESIKTIESVTNSEVRLKYSVERMVQDIFLDKEPRLVKSTLYRTVRRTDLETAFLYEQQFSEELPEMIPEATAIGTSAAVLNALKSKGESKLGIFITYTQIKPPIDRNVHPNVYDNQMVANVTRVGDKPVMIPILVNDTKVELPAIQARGDFFGDKSEFFFLDDPANPLALKFRVGIDYIKPIDPGTAKATGVQPRPGRDREMLQVTKITYRCTDALARGSGNETPVAGRGGTSGVGLGGASLERALAESGRADVYSIYFSFNSDVIREESEPTLKEIAEVLRRHPDWKLQVNGHTDGIGNEQRNLDLSRRRASAVKDALVKRYGVGTARLTTQGFGKSQPKDTNDTLEGRARNRRVELVKVS
jgi:outer membrane protein OmpA-like peptidoglycan-associated protein